jgi:hypothetical protein
MVEVMSTRIWGIVGLGLGVGACGGSGSGPGAEPEPTSAASVISCVPWHREPIPGTEMVLVNNTWNEAWSDGAPHSQCLLERTKGGRPQYGWNWEWPPYKPFASYAAPEAIIGWKAWDGGASTSSAFPRRIDAIDSLDVDFAVELEAEATHNLNASMWVTATDVATAASNPADIRAEVMVWFSDPADLGGGEYDGTVTLGDVEFDLWHVVNQPDASGGTTHEWTMLTYAARMDRHAGAFDLKLVLDDAVDRGLVDPGHAVGGVELITEVFGGSGELWLERFDVKMTP